MSKIIRVNPELLLFALKYSVSSDGKENETVINNIYANLDNLDNEELCSYLDAIEFEITKTIHDDTWREFKASIEKELSVRANVKRLVAAFEKSL